MNIRSLRIVVLLGVIVSIAVGGRSQNPPITPAWAFGHIAWEDSLNTSVGAKTLVEEYLRRDIPVAAVIIDSPWSDSYNDFNWDTSRYPDHAEMIRHFRDRDVKVLLWLTGATNTASRDTRVQKSANYDYAVSKNYGINDSRQGTWWKGTGIHIDFTNRKAKKWWFKQLDKVFVDGVYGWKVDQGEMWFGDPIETSIGTMSNEEFRPYYYDAMYDYTISRNPAGVAMSRPYSHQGGFAASVGKMNLGWCGDFGGNWRGLKQQIDNIYRSAERGYGAPVCEVAGFYMSRSDKVQFVRYSQFGAMTAGMLNGGENGAFSNHLPWFHGPDVEDIYRFCVVLHDQLIPYLFSTVVDAHLNGGSLLKGFSYEQESHRLGNDIFTKAITSEESRVSFDLPAGDNWIDFWTGETLRGGTTVAREYPLDQFPLYFREGSIIPMNIDNSLTGIGNATLSGRQTLLIHRGTSPSRLLYHAPRGEGVEYDDVTVSYDPANGKVVLRSAAEKDFALLFKNMDPVSAVQGDCSSWYYDGAARELRIMASGKNLDLTLVD